MKLEHARILANEVVQLMAPYCERIEVAGSIRREAAEVKDIEVVCIPKWEERPAMDFSEQSLLFTETTTQRMVKINLLHEAVIKGSASRIAWIKPGVSEIVPWTIKSDGKYWRGLLLDIAPPTAGKRSVIDGIECVEGPSTLTQIKLDLFLCRPENWGVIYCIRTGSADFSRALVTYARDKTPYRVEGGYLVETSGVAVNCPEEAHLFACLQIEPVEPHLRRSDRDVRPL